MKPAGLKSYDKRRRKAVFECIVPGTGSRKRVRKVVTVKGWDDLLEQLRNFRERIQRPEAVAPAETPTLAAYIQEHWESYAVRLSTDKRKSNEAIIKHHLLPLLGKTRIDRITNAHAEDLIASMRRKMHNGRSYSNSYINTILQLLRGILYHAYRRRVLCEPPFNRERLPHLTEPTIQNELTVDERDEVLASFENETGFREHFKRLIAKSTKKKIFKAHSEYATYYYERFRWSKPLFTIALYTGLRRSDLTHLRWGNIDLQAGVIRLVMRKTERPVTIPITPRVDSVLRECRLRPVMREYVLVTPEGKPYSKSTIARYFTIAKTIAGITRRFRFHDQRHTFASILASRGINAFTLRDLLGHTSTRTTERYARPSTEAIVAVRKALS